MATNFRFYSHISFCSLVQCNWRKPQVKEIVLIPAMLWGSMILTFLYFFFFFFCCHSWGMMSSCWIFQRLSQGYSQWPSYSKPNPSPPPMPLSPKKAIWIQGSVHHYYTDNLESVSFFFYKSFTILLSSMSSFSYFL